MYLIGKIFGMLYYNAHLIRVMTIAVLIDFSVIIVFALEYHHQDCEFNNVKRSFRFAKK